MLGRILQRFRTAVPPVAGPAVAAGAPDAVPVPAVPVAPSAVASTTIAPEPDDAALAAVLRDTLARRCAELEAALPAGPASADARRLLTDLGREGAAAIRQPPAAAQQALAASRNPDTDILDLVRVFERDPLLTQALLRRANASWYATSTTACVSIREAVWRIGLEGVHSVLLGTMVEGMLCRPGGEYEAMVTKVWEHMVRTAPLARALAPGFGIPVDQAFTLALLHDVGKLVVFDRLASLRGRERRTLRMPPGALSPILQQLHEPLGGLTALAWGLGAPSARAVFTHHRTPLRYEGDRASEVLALAERADLAAQRGVTLDLDAVAAELGLSGDLARTRAVLERAVDVQG